jgi:hypothetical protein
MSYSESDYLDAVAYLDKQAKRDRKYRELHGVERYMTDQERQLIIDTAAKVREFEGIDGYIRDWAKHNAPGWFTPRLKEMGFTK